MAYEFLTDKEVDLRRFGCENASLQFDFDKDKGYLRITLFDNDHYQEDLVIDIPDDFGL